MFYFEYPLIDTTLYEASPSSSTNTGIDETDVVLTGVTAISDGSLPAKQTITVTCNNSQGGLANAHGYVFTATGCRLSSVSQDGGDTGGGNASTTYGYTTYNDLVISG